MAKFAYKCNACKLRHMFRRRLETYVRQKKCDRCGNTTFHWDGERNRRTFGRRKDLCYCGSPYSTVRNGPHRIGSKLCQHNPDFEKNLRVAMGEQDVELAMLVEGKLKGDAGDDCPF